MCSPGQDQTRRRRAKARPNMPSPIRVAVAGSGTAAAALNRTSSMYVNRPTFDPPPYLSVTLVTISVLLKPTNWSAKSFMFAITLTVPSNPEVPKISRFAEKPAEQQVSSLPKNIPTDDAGVANVTLIGLGNEFVLMPRVPEGVTPLAKLAAVADRIPEVAE